AHLNRALRQAGLLAARDGPFGETLDTFASTAFAVCDHQVAHVYVAEPAAQARTKDVLQAVPGVARVLAGDERAELDLWHDRAGELVVLSEPDAWFAYPYWLDDARAPDFARTVDIHRKPGYDPCELFFDPQLLWAKGRVIRKLLLKKLGFRTLLDVVPLHASLVKGSHGLRAPDAESGPLLIGDGAAPAEGVMPMTAVRGRVLEALDLADA